jgi:predicted regulator of Ras-like GTPase activity (Roadblock/LC7/MglB family)
MLFSNLRTILAELLQEIPGCISIFLQDNTTGEVIARAIQGENITTRTPENQFFKLQNMAQEAVEANGEEKFNEIVISGEKQINLLITLQQKYMLWLSAASSTKMGVTRYKLSKYLPSIEKILVSVPGH